MENIVPGKFSGEGIKKTPAYETPLSKHDLDKWRKEFWETRTSGNRQIWNCDLNTMFDTCTHYLYSNVSIAPLIFLDTGKAHRVAANFMKWLFSLLFLDRDVQMSEK